MAEYSNERKKQLLEMWRKIREWVKSNCQFDDMKRFDFPHDTFHWTAFEVYPNGECAVLRGSHGNPGESRPTLICGTEEFRFSMADNAPSWNGVYGDLATYRSASASLPYRGVECSPVVKSYGLLDDLFRNWGCVKGQIRAEIASDDRLAEFIP